MGDQRVSLAAIGMGYREDIDQNIAPLLSDLTLTGEDRHLLADFSAKAYESPRIKAMRVDQEKKSPVEMARDAMRQYDKNRDRKLSRQEFPAGQLRYFDACDSDKDRLVSLEELADAIKRRRRQ